MFVYLSLLSYMTSQGQQSELHKPLAFYYIKDIQMHLHTLQCIHTYIHTHTCIYKNVGVFSYALFLFCISVAREWYRHQWQWFIMMLLLLRTSAGDDNHVDYDAAQVDGREVWSSISSLTFVFSSCGTNTNRVRIWSIQILSIDYLKVKLFRCVCMCFPV